jgi:hypothetical protein
MDKGFCPEAIYQLIQEDLHAGSIIEILSWNKDPVGGTYHQ